VRLLIWSRRNLQ